MINTQYSLWYMSSMNTEEIFKVFGKKIPDFIPEKYKKAISCVLPQNNKEKIPWNYVIPDEIFFELNSKYNEQEQKLLSEIGQDIEYYNKIYSETKKVFSFLKPAKINAVKYKLYSFNEENKKHLNLWKPDKYGFLPVPEYSLCESVTGRMKIKSGPNILLLPKKFRDIISSRFGNNGSIWYLDFVSLEPRIALTIKHYISSSSLLIGSVPLTELLNFSVIDPLPKDIYSLALKFLKITNEISRDTLKIIVLSQLYGQSKSHTIETLEKYKIRNPDEIVEMVNDFFGINLLRQFVEESFLKTSGKFLRTFYGRHLSSDDGKPHALLNYYIQSTAVDVALLGFFNILNRLKDIFGALDLIVPIFVLHDAIILDVHKNIEHIIPKLCAIGSKDIPGFKNQPFWMTGNKL